MLGKYTDKVREIHPLIHNITNYVTVNDCANVLLACGGSPIMSDDAGEVEEITTICSGLNINIGTLNERTIKSMFLAGKRANDLNHPVILDPVGAGASSLRTQTAKALLSEVKFAAIRGNISEIKAIALGSSATKGVDADALDAVSDENLTESAAFAKDLAKQTGSVIAITGAIDIVSDAERAFVIRNGVPAMASITGSGCMLSAMTTAYVAAGECAVEAAAAAVCAMGLCGEKAYAKMLETGSGNSSFRNFLIDSIYNLTGEELDKGARFDII